MSATFSIDRRIYLCAFTFADGRRCRIPRSAGHPDLCTFPAKDAAARAAQQFDQQFDREIVSDLSSEYTSACDLTPALRRFFAAVARGQAKPKAANTLAYLGQIMVQSIHLAQNQCIKAFGNRAGSKLSPATPTQRDAQPSRRRTKPRIRSQHQQPR